MNPLPLVLSLKNIINWYCPVIGFSKHFFIAFDFKKYSNGLLTRFNRNRICIIVFNCNIYINFIPFVGVSNSSIKLLLSIYITELFKKVFDSIEGIIFLLILLSQLNYLISNNFRLSLQRMTIRKITTPNIFQVFREGKKMFSVTLLT